MNCAVAHLILELVNSAAELYLNQHHLPQSIGCFTIPIPARLE